MVQYRLGFWRTACQEKTNEEKTNNFHNAGIRTLPIIVQVIYNPGRMSETTPDFETALKRLEEIVKKLEGGELSLDSALELFEEGIKLSRFCHTKLEQAERRVEILMKNNSGQPQAVPFETENEK